MDGDVELLKRIYDRFNARDIDGVLAVLADDVAWANGMDGGHVHGREAVREYWTRQWTMVSPHVEPASFHRTADGAIIAEVRQSVRNLEGKPLQGQTHGLKDKTVGHVFRLREGKVARFDIQDAAEFQYSRNRAPAADRQARGDLFRLWQGGPSGRPRSVLDYCASKPSPWIGRISRTIGIADLDAVLFIPDLLIEIGGQTIAFQDGYSSF